MISQQPARRAFAGVVTIVVLAFTTLISAQTAHAADSDLQAASRNSLWLAGELDSNGALPNPWNPDIADYGLMIDMVWAMYASGNKDLAGPTLTYLNDKRQVTKYWRSTTDGVTYISSGGLAKSLVAALATGRNPKNFGGYDLFDETLRATTMDGWLYGYLAHLDIDAEGNVKTDDGNIPNMFMQSLAIMGLAGTNTPDAYVPWPLVTNLQAQQCSEGYFRIFHHFETGSAGDPSVVNPVTNMRIGTCDEGKDGGKSAPDRDATAMSLSALLATKESFARAGNPIDALDDSITRAVRWLEQDQTPSDGWSGGVGTENPNTNSSGLVVQALAQAKGSQNVIDKGAAFIRSSQATSAADRGNKLAGDIGAIGYSPQEYTDARATGISDGDRWVRASAQASLGLSRVSFWDLMAGKLPSKPVLDPTPRPGPTADPPPTRPGAPGKPGKGGAPGAKAGNAGPPPPGAAPVRPVSPRAGVGGPRPGMLLSRALPVRPKPPSPTAVAGSATPAGRTAAYLANQLVDGDHLEITEGDKTYVDYDGTADLIFALTSLGEQPAAALAAARFLIDPRSMRAYAHGAPYETGYAAYAEPLAKTALAARIVQRSPSPPEDIAKTISALDAALSSLAHDGRFVDVGTHGDQPDDTSRHAWATLAAVAAGSDPAEDAMSELVSAACKDGGFPSTLPADKTDCAAGDAATTGWVTQVLNATPAGATAASPSASASVSRTSFVAPVSRSDTTGAAQNTTPEEWSNDRRDALTASAALLNDLADSRGLVTRTGGRVDLPTSASVAAGRQLSGFDTRSTATSVAAMVSSDGSVPAQVGASKGAVRNTLASAPALSGASWLAQPSSPVVAAVKLPLDDAVVPSAPPNKGSSWRTVTWLVIAGFALLGSGFLAARLLPPRGKRAA